jgi:hypothetical protein
VLDAVVLSFLANVLFSTVWVLKANVVDNRITAALIKIRDLVFIVLNVLMIQGLYIDYSLIGVPPVLCPSA